MTAPRSLAGIIAALTLSLLTSSLSAGTQQAARIPRIGMLCPTVCQGPVPDTFLIGLQDLGYAEGQNIVIERRSSDGKYDRLSDLATELVQLGVDVLVTPGVNATRAAIQATGTIPIVMVAVGDISGVAAAAGAGQPASNVTGSIYSPIERWRPVELVKELVPGAARVAVIWNRGNPANNTAWRQIQGIALSRGVTFLGRPFRTADELEGAFTAIAADRADAIILIADPVLLNHRNRVVELAASSRLPTVYGHIEMAEAGGLVAYAPNIRKLSRSAASYVDKILKGAKPGDLPVEQPTKFELVVNLKTAKTLGLKIPQSILIRADEVIQ